MCAASSDAAPSVELSSPLMAAVEGTQVEKVAKLLTTLNPCDDKDFDQALMALRVAIGINCVPVAASLVDWFKEFGAFDEKYTFRFDHQLKNFSDQELLCLAKAGYEFSYKSFPSHCDDKTVAAIQDIIFGEGLQRSPLYLLNNDSSRNSEDIWICIARCGMLDEDLNFDATITGAELLLQGFRKPVANWLAELLGFCSSSPAKVVPDEIELSDQQVYFFGLMLLNAMQSPPTTAVKRSASGATMPVAGQGRTAFHPSAL